MKEHYIQERVESVDPDFLEFEVKMANPEDLELINKARELGLKLPNPHNSCIMYVLGITDEFDFDKARCDTVDGAPPDVDMDFESIGREEAKDIVVENWGRDNVANIGTFSVFQPKSLTRKYYSITEPHAPDGRPLGQSRDMYEILEVIPRPLYGKEATLEEIVEGDEKNRGTKPQPWLKQGKFADWYEFTNHLEGMISHQGIHAAGIIISDFPVKEVVPIWNNSSAERITQFDMKEVENLGLIKFDFLAINNLDIIKECCRLVEKHYGKKYDPWTIPDGNEKAYALMHQGLLSGIFQMETSGSAKDLVMKIKPTNIGEISDISALNRPGPLNNGFHFEYIANKEAGTPPRDMPPLIAKILEDTYWTMTYQEQLMQFMVEIAGLSLQEADDARRGIGKKKIEVLNAVKPKFTSGCIQGGMNHDDAEKWWEAILKFADYGFAKAHSIPYSYLTYLCAYFKANYPEVFFCALMTIRSKTMQPKLWAQKAPEYVMEAKTLGVHILPPSIQHSGIGFTIKDNEVYFGMNGIRGIGATAAQSIVSARGTTPFKSIQNFLTRVDRRKVNTKVFRALIESGAFDRIGYKRAELNEKTKDLYEYFKDMDAYGTRLVDADTRAQENLIRDRRKSEIDEKVKEAKAQVREDKKQGIPSSNYTLYWANRASRLKELRSKVKEFGEQVLTKEEKREYDESLWLRKKPELKLFDKPVWPELNRSKEIHITLDEILQQAEMIGCFLTKHPAMIVYPEKQRLASVDIGDYVEVAGYVANLKEITTRKGDRMAFMQFGDGTGIAEGILFPEAFTSLNIQGKIPEHGHIISVLGKVEEVDQVIKIIVKNIEIYGA